MNGASPSKLQPALIGGVSLGVASAIPLLGCLNCACCALVIGGGFLASALYFKDATPSPEPPYGDGAILGALAGVFGAIVYSIVNIPMTLVFGKMSASFLRGFFENLDLPPEADNAMQQALDNAGTLTVGGVLSSLGISLVVFTIFAMIGGIIGVAVFHKKSLQAQQAQP